MSLLSYHFMETTSENSAKEVPHTGLIELANLQNPFEILAAVLLTYSPEEVNPKQLESEYKVLYSNVEGDGENDRYAVIFLQHKDTEINSIIKVTLY